MPGDAQTRLAVYGSLAPGQPNHHELAGITGRWTHGTVRGTRFEEGWGAAIGFPGLVLNPSDPPVTVQLLESPDLPMHWARLDDFEGEGYVRISTPVQTDAGEINAFIYVLADPNRPADQAAR